MWCNAQRRHSGYGLVVEEEMTQLEEYFHVAQEVRTPATITIKHRNLAHHGQLRLQNDSCMPQERHTGPSPEVTENSTLTIIIIVLVWHTAHRLLDRS
jgi:hypothetical protein